ncbi:MAG: peptide chain release factor N(5)-glutamine methyltransferase [Pseudomonadota bacterium]
MLLQSLWRWAFKTLIPNSSTPHLDAELLLAAHLGLTRVQLYSQAACFITSLSQQHAIKAAIKRRKAGEPIAYLLGQQEFWSLMFTVNSSVLIPRPETELLVQLVLENYTHETRKIADLGTGSGAIALALASERPRWQLIATDYCNDALQLAEQNRHCHGLQNVELRQGDWCHAFLASEIFDAIVSNPPYLSRNDAHFQSELGLGFEPKIALISEENGLRYLEVIIRQACHHLLPGGVLFLEHGYEQAAFVRQFFLKYGYHRLQQHKDLAGHQRVTSGKWH